MPSLRQFPLIYKPRFRNYWAIILHPAAGAAEDSAGAADLDDGAGGDFHIADVKRLFGEGKFVHDLLRGQTRNVVGSTKRRDTARRNF